MGLRAPVARPTDPEPARCQCTAQLVGNSPVCAQLVALLVVAVAAITFPFPPPPSIATPTPQRHSQTLRTIGSIARCARILSSSPVCFVAGCATPFPETKNFQNPTSTEIQNGGPTCIPCSRCGLLDNTARRVQPGRARRSPAFLRKASPATAPKHTFWRSPLFNPAG